MLEALRQPFQANATVTIRISSLVLSTLLLPLAFQAAAAPARQQEAPAPLLQTACQQAYARGLEALSRDELKGAEGAFTQCLSAEPTHADSLLGLAEVAFRRKDLTAARRWLDKAQTAAPSNPNVLASLGRAHALQGELANAETTLLEAIRLAPSLVRPRMDLADLYATSLRKPAEAISLYETVLKLEPGHAGARYALGITQTRTGSLQEGRSNLERAATLATDNPLPALALAQLEATQGNSTKALEWAQQASRIDPRLAAANELQGDLLAGAGRAEEALAHYRKIPATAPSHGTAQFKIGMLLQARGEHGPALKAYQAAIAADPNNPFAHNNLAWLLADRAQQLETALTSARKAVQLQPQNPEFLDTLASVHRARKDLASAETALSTAVALDGAGSGIHQHYGEVLSERHKEDEAHRAYVKALELDPNNTAARQALEGRTAR